MSRPLAVFLAATLLASGAAPLAAGAPARLHRQQAEGRVIGRVVDARTNAPLSSVRVSVVGTAIGVLTNADGRYELLAGVAVTGLGAVLLFVLAPRKETALATS